MKSVEDEFPILGNHYIVNKQIEAYCLYCPFNREETNLGWLYFNPLNNNLKWAVLIPSDEYEEINKDKFK